METSAAETWIYGTLAGDATLAGLVGARIYNTRRPSDGALGLGALPCVVFQLQASNDLMVVGATRVWSRLTYVVRGIGEPLPPSYEGTLRSVADRIDALLHGKSGSSGAGVVWSCVRVRPFQMAEVPPALGGREFRHLGGVYEVQAR
jgi:hypothetical protein